MTTRSNLGTKLASAIFILALVLVSASAAQARDFSIAVVVNPDNSVDSISLAELRQVFLGEKHNWPDGSPIFPVVHAAQARERDVLLRSVLRMTERQFREYWSRQLSSGKAKRPPLEVVSNGMQVQTVQTKRGGIALVASSDVGTGLKVLKVNGHLPGSAAYPLKTTDVH